MIPSKVREIAIRNGWEEESLNRNEWKMKFNKYKRLPAKNWFISILEFLRLRRPKRVGVYSITYWLKTDSLITRNQNGKLGEIHNLRRDQAETIFGSFPIHNLYTVGNGGFNKE